MYYKLHKIIANITTLITIRISHDREIIERFTLFIDNNESFKFSEDFFLSNSLDECIKTIIDLSPTVQYDFVVLDKSFNFNDSIKKIKDRDFYNNNATHKIGYYLRTIESKSYPYNIARIYNQKPLNYDEFVLTL